ncbi:hypothetical protein Fmac_032496 [Flemingia macrophylla]|uniref:Uncharacterized protein n=1 Tax=Flemingia macrophylla TaxID=520843 RepID=A0ABD1L6G1_9FABA
MALQEHSSSEVNTIPAPRSFTIASGRNIIFSKTYLFVFPKTLLFIGGLFASYQFVEIAVVSTLVDYLTNFLGTEQRRAVVVTTLQDALSSIVFVFVSSIAEAYLGCFTMITLCAAASIEGLMLLWMSTTTSTASVVYVAIFLLALGKSGQKLSENFLKYQFVEKIRAKMEREQDQIGESRIIINIWLPLFVFSVGYGIQFCVASTMNNVTYENMARFAALLMGGTHLWFLFGHVGYRCEELSDESNLHMIYRICKAAFEKRKSKYPATANSYHWKNYMQKHCYDHGKGVGLLPRVPRLFRWLDKAAIIEGEDCSDLEVQEKKGKLCMVKEVREVKSLVLLIYLSFSISGYYLFQATGMTYFVLQVNIMTRTLHGNDMWILILIRVVMFHMSQFICFVINNFAFLRLKKLKAMDDRSKRKAGALAMVGVGILSAVTCSLVAWKVEGRRLSIIHNENGDLKQGGRNTTMALVPQFVLLGITEGLVEGGLKSLFEGIVASSLCSFVDSFIEMVLGTGKLLTMPVFFIFSFWLKETINTSHLDRFYLMLGILNTAFLLVFGYYSIRYVYKEAWPEDEELTMALEHAHRQPQPDSRRANDDDDNKHNWWTKVRSLVMIRRMMKVSWDAMISSDTEARYDA